MATKKQEQTIVEEKPEVKVPRRFKVIFLNDNYTPFEFVIALLMQQFHKTEAEAIMLTQKVDKDGKAVVGIYTKEIAATKVKIANETAKNHDFPLKVTMEAE